MPPTIRDSIVMRLNGLLTRSESDRLRRRRAITTFLTRRLPILRQALFCIGFLWLCALPLPRLGRTTYIDENALQPGQVNTIWDWGNVHRADILLGQLEELVAINASTSQRANFLRLEFKKMGLPAATQSYSFKTSRQTTNGTNAFAILSSPRTAGTEAMVISASWISGTGDGNGTLNMRGVATVLALASFLQRHSLWAKDIIFVVGDGYLDGMHAWLSTYHGVVQSNLHAEPLALSSGVIWTALNIDYPGHSFSHLGVFSEGLDGLLPNQDLFNSFQIISRHTGGVPVVLYDHVDPRESGDHTLGGFGPLAYLPPFVRDMEEVKEYAVRSKNVLRHLTYQAFGKPTGAHGLFRRYRIDAITLFAVPAVGPHGFHAIGRIVESTLRTMNNLLERLHASFFFYILTTPGTFLKIGHYLPSVVLISVALMFGGLSEWVKSGWIELKLPGEKAPEGKESHAQWERRNRPVLDALLAMLATHAAGLLLFASINSGLNFYTLCQTVLPDGDLINLFMNNLSNLVSLEIVFYVICWALDTAGVTSTKQQSADAPLSMVLKATNLCLASTVISITSVLNFSLAAMLATSLTLPLSHSSSSVQGPRLKQHAYLLFTASACTWLVTKSNYELWDWEMFGVWYAPFMCVVYVPLLLQSALVCRLSS